jgi:hypothetical protein
VTRDAGFKRLVRARMEKTGESYAAARAQLHGRLPRPGVVPADLELIAATSAPIGRSMQMGDPAARVEVLRGMSVGQRALFAFWVLHAHSSNGLSGFCAEMPHRVVHDGYRTLLDAAVHELGIVEVLVLFDRLRSEVRYELVKRGLPADLGADGLLDGTAFQQLAESAASVDPIDMAALDVEFLLLMPLVTRRVARYIRRNPAEFANELPSPN